jgi:hypothetical protein
MIKDSVGHLREKNLRVLGRRYIMRDGKLVSLNEVISFDSIDRSPRTEKERR